MTSPLIVSPVSESVPNCCTVKPPLPQLGSACLRLNCGLQPTKKKVYSSITHDHSLPNNYFSPKSTWERPVCLKTPFVTLRLIQSLVSDFLTLQLTTRPSLHRGRRHTAAMKARRTRRRLPRFLPSLSCEGAWVCPWSWPPPPFYRSLRC